ALALEQLGVRSGDPVAVMGQTTGEWAISDLGILAALGVSVGIYPSLAPSQVSHILRDCGAKLAFVGGASELRTLKSLLPEVPSLQTIIGWGDAEKDAALGFSSL